MSAAKKRLLAAIDAAITTGKPREARTTPALASAAHCSLITAQHILRAALDARELHVEDWARTGRAGPRSPIYLPGDGPDAPYPDLKRQQDNGERRTRHVDWRTAPSGQRIAQWFRDGGRGNEYQVMTACNVSRATAWSILDGMHADHALVIVERVRQWSGKPYPVFEWRAPGDTRRDVPQLPALSTKARRKRHKRRLANAFGPEIAQAIARAMFNRAPRGTVVMVDGKPIYARGKGMLVPLQQEVSHG